MAAPTVEDDFSRRVYCILGSPVDDVTMTDVVSRIHRASAARARLFISTPNLNFLMLGQRDSEFRRSLLESHICTADGVGVLFICRLLGVPITSRVAGSDLPAALQASRDHTGTLPLRITLFGGAPGVGERACAAINAGDTGRLICVAATDPGELTADKMNDTSIVDRINATGADFLLVALGAQKGQAWLLRNLEALSVPVVSHLGATLNFLAGTVRRAPVGVRKLGMEWLWRISEEPRLASRYFSDGVQLFRIILSRIVPLGFWLRWNRVGQNIPGPSVRVVADESGLTRIIVQGAAPDDQLSPVVLAFRSAALAGHSVVLDLHGLEFFEMRFAGYVLMLEKTTMMRRQTLTIEGVSSGVARALAWCGLKHLIARV